ncbi:MAG: hypothetical protein Q4F13_03075 [Pseudomonadota bacterium]|nr:hypothetical protein [Pseudomonadota bacterium]
MTVPEIVLKWHQIPLHGTFLHCIRKSPAPKGGHTNFFNEIKHLASKHSGEKSFFL